MNYSATEADRLVSISIRKLESFFKAVQRNRKTEARRLLLEITGMLNRANQHIMEE